MATEDTQAFLERTQRSRGYTLEMHRIMAEADREWAEKWNEFMEATYTGQRLLDRKTKELLQIVVEAALRADVEQIQAHVRVALQEGATPPGDIRGIASGHRAHGGAGLPSRTTGLGRRNRISDSRVTPGKHPVSDGPDLGRYLS